MLILDQSTIKNMNKELKLNFGQDTGRFQLFLIGFIIGILVNFMVQYYRIREEKEQMKKRYNWTEIVLSGLIVGILCWIYASF